jgi:hypothetical protein
MKIITRPSKKYLAHLPASLSNPAEDISWSDRSMNIDEQTKHDDCLIKMLHIYTLSKRFRFLSFIIVPDLIS